MSTLAAPGNLGSPEVCRDGNGERDCARQSRHSKSNSLRASRNSFSVVCPCSTNTGISGWPRAPNEHRRDAATMIGSRHLAETRFDVDCLPGGENDMNAAWEELRSLVDEKCLTVGRSYTLTTGRQSAFYFDCKKAMLDGKCLGLIADAFLDEAGKLSRYPKAIGGLTMGADFIVAAVIQRAFETGKPPVSGSIVRKEQKRHGAGNKIENELPQGTPIMVVDDVVTTGSSTVTACDAFLAAGYDIVGIVALVDRESGGCETLAQKYGCPVGAVFRKRDFPRIEQQMNDAPEIKEPAVSDD